MHERDSGLKLLNCDGALGILTIHSFVTILGILVIEVDQSS